VATTSPPTARIASPKAHPSAAALAVPAAAWGRDTLGHNLVWLLRQVLVSLFANVGGRGVSSRPSTAP